MTIKIVRRYLGDKYTIGSLYINDKYLCDTLEDVVRDEKIKYETAIPSGEYHTTLTVSPRFKRALPHIHSVDGFNGIRIHRGNTPEDTSGCILVGENKIKGQLISSTKYEMEIVSKMLKYGGTCKLIIE